MLQLLEYLGQKLHPVGGSRIPMNDILLAKPNLPHGYLDLSAGEPYIIRECLEKTFSLNPYTIPNEKGIWEYPYPNGQKDLVRMLEDKHKSPVVITNGAKQGL